MDKGLIIGLIILGIVAVLIIGLVIGLSIKENIEKKKQREITKIHIGTYDTSKIYSNQNRSESVQHKTYVEYMPYDPSREVDETEPKSYTDIIGEEGENAVDRILKEVQEINGGEVYKNLILTDDYNNHTEIDNIYVSECGIFIIETKTWGGSIKGKKYDKKWSITDNYTNKIREQGNPFIQNDRHVDFFKRVVHTSCEITPIVVFISDVANYVECKEIVMSNHLKDYLLKFEYLELDDIEYDYVVGKLNHFKNNPPMTHEQYKNNVKKRYKNN